MCTPTSHTPSRRRRIESASSKSFASAGSTVKVVTARKSRRRASSSGSMRPSMASAARSTASSKRWGRSYSASMACISVSLSPAAPSTSTSSPVGCLLPGAQSATRITTLSPSSTSGQSRRGTKTSHGMRRESQRTNTACAVTSATPTRRLPLRRTMRTISPSSAPLRPVRVSTTSTVSPSRALSALRGLTNTSCSRPSMRTKIAPVDTISAVPVMRGRLRGERRYFSRPQASSTPSATRAFTASPVARRPSFEAPPVADARCLSENLWLG